jgi:hypothetical protein
MVVLPGPGAALLLLLLLYCCLYMCCFQPACACRSHVESLIAAAAAQQVQSELAVRVSSWRTRIDPILAAEEDRSAFDIHDYGTKIISRYTAGVCGSFHPATLCRK